MYFIAGIKFYYRKHQKILRKFKRKYNIRPLHYNFGSGYESEKLLLGIFPAWFAPRQQDWPKNLVLTDFLLFSDSNCSNDVNRFIAENEEYVVVMSGSMSSFSEHTTEVFLEFYRMRCIPIIFVGNFQETKIDGVIFVKNIDLGYLLKGAKMIVHQGGIGTTGHAINSGVPQIVLPHCFDQFDNAKRVRDLGVGDFILPSNLNISSFLPVFDSLLLRYKWSNLNEKYAGRTNSDAAVNRIVDMLILEHSA
jgi:UDP:flavonoid glycosyltransferase YjiC (YdhE family)